MRCGFRSLVVPLVVLMTAGCIGATEEAPSPPACDEPCRSCAGDGCGGEVGCQDCSPCGGIPDEARCPPPPPAPVEPRRTAFRFEGDLGMGACLVLPGRGLCAALREPEGEVPELEDGQPRSLHANVTWTATTPAADKFYVSMLVDFGEGWTWDPAREPTVRAPSPLQVDWDLSAYPPGTRFRLYIESGALVEEPVGVWAMPVPQRYVAEGAFVGVPAG